MKKRGKKEGKKTKSKEKFDIKVKSSRVLEKIKEVNLPKIKVDRKRANKFFKFNKSKLIILLIIIGISLVFQWIFGPSKCLSVICSPYILGILYYIFWPFDLLAILILGSIPPNRILLTIIKIIFLIFQAAYWYILACLLAIPINKGRGFIGKKVRTKKRERDISIKEGIARDLKRADEIEAEKKRLQANVF